MPYEVVARRWRPLTFESVVGQQHITATLAHAIERERVAHAFLFTGIRGVGKTTVARVLARALNCTGRQTAEPCNACPSCKQILSGSSVDVLEIDGASNRGIEEVRDLINAARYRPAGSRYRIYIIDEVHQLTREAFNALLKILEEPPAHVKFVLATTEPQKVPATVLSRCQRYDFRRLGADEIRDHLAHIAGQDGFAVSKDALALIAREADGSMRDGQSLLEQIVASAGKKKVEVAEVARLLGTASADLVGGCLESILEGKAERLVACTHELRSAGYDPERFLFDLLDLLRYVTVANATGGKQLPSSLAEAAREVALRLKDVRSQLDLQRIFHCLLATAEDLRSGVTPELVLEMGLLKAAALESVRSAAEILAQLERLTGDRGGRGSGRHGSSTAPAAGSAGHSSTVTRTARSSHEALQAGAAAVPEQPAAVLGEQRVTEREERDTATMDPERERWEDFLAYVQKQADMNLYVALSNCEAVEDPQGNIALSPMLEGFRRGLEGAGVLDRIRALAGEHFHRAVGVRIVERNGDKKGANGVSAHSIEQERRRRLEEETLGNSVVRSALEVLGGRIQRISRLEE